MATPSTAVGRRDGRDGRRFRAGLGAAVAVVFVAASALVLARGFAAQERGQGDLAKKQLEYTVANYVKREYRVPMRDGVKLFTSVYVPKDAGRTYPIMIQRTPYSVAPYGEDKYKPLLGPSEMFAREGFIFAYQDVRGRYMSEGEFVDIPPRKARLAGPRDTDETTDTYDTIDWLVKNVPGNNGRAGIWGGSYGGFFSAFGMIDAHPALVAASPQAPIGDVANGDDSFHNGAFFLGSNFGFYYFFRPRPGGPSAQLGPAVRGLRINDAYDFFLRMGPISNSETLYFKGENPYWTAHLDHPNYDEFWRSRSLVPHMKGIRPAVLFVGGWYDAEDLAGPLKLFYELEKNGPLAPDTLVMGPWRHGGWSRGDGEALGSLRFGSKTSEFYRERIEFPFFMERLKGAGKGLAGEDGSPAPKAWLFETGADEWRRFDAWPPRDAREASLYLLPGGRLAFEPAAVGAGGGAAGAFDEYLSDPARPVPVVGHTTGEGMPGDYMAEDQRFAARRPDVLVYATEPLERDLAVAGPVAPLLRVSTTGTDADFVVKLIDVYPDDFPDPAPNPDRVRMGGYQRLVRGEPFRGKFRNSLEKPEPFTPGRAETIDFRMPDVCHTFLKGHRIMVHVQSSWFPLVDRNPQTFVDIPKAAEADFRKATIRVYQGGAEGSRLRVLVR
ncbi:MAG TPA: CocE/NonD family hydrolase [Candidatus Aminicenantes bacterium]|nr:CocE/NonD family hydrolase [Candidatus Aminicenantes bacterium]